MIAEKRPNKIGAVSLRIIQLQNPVKVYIMAFYGLYCLQSFSFSASLLRRNSHSLQSSVQF